MAQQRHARHSHKKHTRTVIVIDKCMYAIGIVGPIMTTPQLLDAYQKHVQGLSLATWTAYTIVSFLWFLMAISIKKNLLLLPIYCIF